MSITITADSREELLNWVVEALRVRRVKASDNVREILRQRQKSRCADCGDRLIMIGPARAHVDHIYPLSAGGTNDIRNLQLSCAGCNLKKGARLPHEHAQAMGRLL